MRWLYIIYTLHINSVWVSCRLDTYYIWISLGNWDIHCVTGLDLHLNILNEEKLSYGAQIH